MKNDKCDKCGATTKNIIDHESSIPNRLIALKPYVCPNCNPAMNLMVEKWNFLKNCNIDDLRKDINDLQELQSIVRNIEERNYPRGVWKECKEWAIISDLKEKLAELEKKEFEMRFAYCKSREKFVMVPEAFSYNGEEMYFYCQSADPKDGLVAYRRENFLFEEDIKELLKNAKTE